MDALEVWTPLVGGKAVERVDCCAGLEQGSGDEEPETAGGACDEDDAFREVEFGEHGAGRGGGAGEGGGGFGGFFDGLFGDGGGVSLGGRGHETGVKA